MKAVRALLVVLALGIVGLVAWTLAAGDDEPTITEVESDEVAVSVGDALTRQPTVAFAVRGFVYDDGAFVQLCNGLTGGEPPTCRGPSMLLEDLDLGRVPIKTGKVDGRTVRYTTEPVVLGGTLEGTLFHAVDVLPDGE